MVRSKLLALLRKMTGGGLCASVLFWSTGLVHAADSPALPGTEALSGEHDFSIEMRAAFRRFLQRQIDESIQQRPTHWARDFSSRAAYEKSIEPNRTRLRQITGVVDARIKFPFGPELVASIDRSALIAETTEYSVQSIRWPVFRGVWGEGLLLEPKRKVIARTVVLPDADQTPEMIAGVAGEMQPKVSLGARLAAAGCQVVIPVLISRGDEFSGNSNVAMTNQPHREWIWRQAYEMGRHIIGYEVQKVLAAVDWFEQRNTGAALPIGVAGYGEGGLVALYAGAMDPRINAVLVSGYFDSRQGIPTEPIYRDVFGLLAEFGDAELASLIVPRLLVIEYSAAPGIAGPPPARTGRRATAAPGRIETPPFERVRQEANRVSSFFAGQKQIAPQVTIVGGDGGSPMTAGSEDAVRSFLRGLGVDEARLDRNFVLPETTQSDEASVRERQRRQVEQLVEFTQGLMRDSAGVRERFWADAPPKAAATWPAAVGKYREMMWNDLIGRYPLPTMPTNARTRQIADKTHFKVYEVLLDVTPEVFAWGYLLVPKNLQPGEKRPVVVCQHGLEGVPADVVTDDPASAAFRTYQGFAARLAERGFITYAPHNFYRGGNEFRELQRLAHPVGKTLFAVTTIQHAQLLRWLSELPFVDPARIGFYGLSYGGNTAMRVPALLQQYAVVIASGDFNEWVFKNVTSDTVASMMFNNVYEVYEFNLGHTFNHADMAALIAPRPFMVERGHDDGVARDEWVAGEYAKVRRLYAKLGIPERTRIEFFNGPHQIHGVGTYAFLHEHLHWPEPRQ